MEARQPAPHNQRRDALAYALVFTIPLSVLISYRLGG